MKLDTKIYEDKMQKSVAVYDESLSSIRVGRANTAVLKGVMVSYYGTPTAINQMAEVKATDPRTLTITPWDMTTLKDIEKAILASDVGITPVNDGRTIRLSFPQLTGDRRKELSKQVSKMGEEAKVAIRNIRREANDKIKEMKKNSEINEDEQKQCEKQTQDLTDKYIKEIDKITDAKSKEIMEL